MEGTIIAARLAEALAPGLPPEIAERLLASPRLGAAAQDWARSGLEGVATLVSPADLALTAAGPDGLVRAAALAGAVWHAAEVRGMLMARDLQAYFASPALSGHGEATREAALRHFALAPGLPAGDPTTPLADRVAASGRACLAAWLDSLPARVGAALRLTLDPGCEGEADALHREHGPGILRAVAAAA